MKIGVSGSNITDINYVIRKLKKHGKKARDLSDTIEFIFGRNF